ncbi:hypothetical protein [Deinococcus sonorensis]|uniref:YtxH domain-containing protein n=2 Tax=Deinococcus sonorensis TaxID=309891 RepID=A0AAU7U6I7_9DEIO
MEQRYIIPTDAHPTYLPAPELNRYDRVIYERTRGRGASSSSRLPLALLALAGVAGGGVLVWRNPQRRQQLTDKAQQVADKAREMIRKRARGQADQQPREMLQEPAHLHPTTGMPTEVKSVTSSPGHAEGQRTDGPALRVVTVALNDAPESTTAKDRLG